MAGSGGEQAMRAKMAREQATEMFAYFGWRKVGPEEQNWDCVTEAHKNEKDKQKQIHTTDIVFAYDDPYETKRVYLNTDLKSYAAGTIKRPKLRKELSSLAQVVECANKSQGWQNLYLGETQNSIVRGLLFIYNHDAKYDEQFSVVLEQIKASSIKLRNPFQVIVFGPKLIWYLYSISRDIQNSFHEFGIEQEDCGFYYPELVRARTRLDQSHAATIEMLTGPWQIYHFPKRTKGGDSGGYLIYYNGPGTTLDEFKYIIDYAFRYQLLRDKSTVQIRMVTPPHDAALNFAKARAAYAEDFYGFEDYGKKEFEQRMERISFKSVPGVDVRYSEIEIGLQ